MPSADNLLAALEGIDANSFSNESERARARDALFEALKRVQSPWDIIWQHNWVNPATNASVKTLIDAGVFEKWAGQGHTPMKCTELAKLTGADELIIKRMMRQIAGQNLVIETAEDTFAPTPWAKALAADPALQNVYGTFYSEVNNPMFRTLPFFLKKTEFKNPTNVNNCNWQYLRGPEANFFQFVGADPAVTRGFNDAMQCHSKYNLTPWPEVYPTETILAAAKPDRALVVDVGGSKGHDLEKFSLRHPNAPAGSLILQDLPGILKDVHPAPSITPHPHDFFTPQPIKGARAYFMHNVLHDWEDTKAIEILQHIAGAMEKGYSRLLIHESLVSSIKPLARVTTSDITMMACLAAKERTEGEWRGLMEKVGLRVITIWRPPQSVESIIEAELSS